MDADLLSYTLDFVAGQGGAYSTEKIIALKTSLEILKQNYKFQRVLLWGKILAMKTIYYIAQGRGEDELTDKKYLYSFDCMNWFLLPSVTDSMIQRVAAAARGPFRGEPSFVYQARTNNSDEDKGAGLLATEEMRLAVTVQHIDEEVSVVPRGAFVKTRGLVQLNRSFGGLSKAEGKTLDNYMHFREPKRIKKEDAQKRGDWSPSFDFLDVLSDDIPKGSWSLQWESDDKVYILSSLLWLGLTFYHVPTTPHHGYIYFGDGQKNVQLHHMI
uniref:Radial spoke head protein 9 homolog n=1 Tax=Nothobranchius pienaari TaxID=704102 RepID=A0A1A8MU06_9TELE